MNILSELRRRKVFRVAAVYAATAFVVLQAAELVLPRLGVPDWAMSFLVAVVLAGFPIAVVLAWALELTPEGGLRRSGPASGDGVDDGATGDRGPGEVPRGDDPPLLGKRTLLAVSLLVVLGIGLGAGWFLRPASGPTAGSTTAAGQPVDPSIAVLPFADLSPERDQAYFSDGLAEEILNLLASVRDLSVASRTSSFSFKGSVVPIPEIAASLDVQYVLEGSVRRAGDRIRVTAQLIDARSDRHLWSENFDRTLADVFAVQDEIAGAIGEALQVELLGAGGQEVASETVDPHVYEQFLQARFRLRQRNDQAIADAVAQLEAVVEAEPAFARALALLAEAYTLGNNPVADPRAEQRVEQALAIDPDLASAIMVRGNIAMIRGEPLSAYTDYQRAIELEPWEPRPYHWIGILFTSMGYLERGEKAIERAAEQLRLAEVAGEAMTLPLRPLVRIARGETDQLDPFIRALRDGEVNPYFASAGLLALDLGEALLEALRDSSEDYAGAVHALFWTDSNAPLRADPRFIRFMERMGAFPLWRELGPPPDCVQEDDTFRCGLVGPP